MRARERERVERHAARALEAVLPGVRLLVGWSRRSWPHVDQNAEAFAWKADAVIVIDEPSYETATPADREDTVRHEIAHLLAWHRHGHGIADHGPEYARARRDVDRALEEELG